MAIKKIMITKTDKTYNKKHEILDVASDKANQLIREGKAIPITEKEEKEYWWLKHRYEMFKE